VKKTLWLVLIIISACLFSLSACDTGTDQPQNPDTEQSTNHPSDNNSSESSNTGDAQTPSTDNTECQHTFGEWITSKQANCSNEGELIRICNKCSFAEKTQIAVNGIHTEVIDQAVAATCTLDGKTEGKHCSVCNKVIVAQQTIQASHTEVIDQAVAATCTTYGKTEGKHCSVCGQTIVAQQKTSMKAHTESNWIVDKESTVDEEGSKYKECSVCHSTVKTETIPKILPSQGLEFTYVSNDVGGNYYVSGIGTCTDTDIVIPSEYNGLPVRAIGNYAFSNCSTIRSVTIPGSVTSIRVGAFSNCTSLEIVKISRGGLNNMGKYVFYNCLLLKKIDYKDWTGCWYAIDKGDGCFDLTGNYNIYCTDAIIDKTGRVTYH